MHRRPAYSKMLLALVLVLPLSAVAQNADPSTSIAEADLGTPPTSIAQPQDPISVTAISSTLSPVETPLPPEEVTDSAIRVPGVPTVIVEPPRVTAPPYSTTPKRDDIIPGAQEQSTTSSIIGVAPPSDLEDAPALRPDPAWSSGYGKSSPIIASSAPPGAPEKETRVGGTKPTPVVVAPQSSPGATGAPQASQAQGPAASSKAPGASQASPVPVPEQRTQ